MPPTKTCPIALFALCLAACIFCHIVGAVCEQVHPGKGSYFPLAVGNSWIYSLHKSPQATTKTIKWRVTQREVVHRTPVFHLWQTRAQDDEPLSLSEVEAGIVEAGSERFLLKNPLRTADRWSAQSRNLRSPAKSDTFEVTSAGKACSVGDHSFSDCVTIREVDESNDVASLTTYARGVGPVKYVYFKGLHSEEVDTSLTIKSWQVH